MVLQLVFQRLLLLQKMVVHQLSTLLETNMPRIINLRSICLMALKSKKQTGVITIL